MLDPIDILVADDDDVIRLIFEVLLKRLFPEHSAAGALRLRMASDGREALDWALAEPPDLILMDLHMPHLDGIAVFRTLREKLGSRCPAVHFMSGYEKTGDLGQRLDRAFEDGAGGFTQKPISEDEIGHIVRAYLPDQGPKASTRPG